MGDSVVRGAKRVKPSRAVLKRAQKAVRDYARTVSEEGLTLKEINDEGLWLRKLRRFT